MLDSLTPARRAELDAALAAVRLASTVCTAVQAELVTPDTLQKKDKSPVTVADFASQAVVCGTLKHALGVQPVVGEENADELRAAGQEELRKRVAGHVTKAAWQSLSESEVLDLIDLGGSPATGDRYWTLDPIDGTKGFLRKEQYAVALALIEKGVVVLGVLGCPNLPSSSGGTGALFAAVRGHGAVELPMAGGGLSGAKAIKVDGIAATQGARFCESVESGHSDQGRSAKVAQTLGITAEPVRMDSQCKYAAVARGDASIYLRLPTSADYRENIWDHAAGLVVIEEAGGKVTDVDGKPLDFSHGRRFEHNRGVIATSGAIHAAVVAAVGAALA